MRFQRILPAIAVVIAACGGDSGDGGDSENGYSHLKLADHQVAPLVEAGSSDNFANYVKNGLRLQFNIRSSGHSSSTGSPMPAEDASADGDVYSNTNVHVEGVDEADLVKYDGRHLFIVKRPEYEDPARGIRIVATRPQEALADSLAFIETSDEFHLGAIYLVADDAGTRDVVSVAHRQHYGYVWDDAADHLRMTDALQVTAFNVVDAEAPEQAWQFELDGALADSRKIGNVLYLVSRFTPDVIPTYQHDSSGDKWAENESAIATAKAEDLLPQYRINGGERQPLVEADGCLLPQDSDANSGYAGMTIITAIDLSAHEHVSSLCINTHVDGLYASSDSLYLGTSVWGQQQTTGVHKFNLDQGSISYRGTGTVPGVIGWRAAGFRMSEHHGDLRIITSQRSAGLPEGTNVAAVLPQDDSAEHLLSVLREQDGSNELDVVSTLPNEQRPDAIGKPNEDIYAVRFYGERAFVVTFEIIDPLYILDLSDSEDPHITGELEVPGFSTYLHPIDDDYLLGIGQNAGVWGPVKVELYDVRGDTPEVVATELIGEEGTYSPALHNLQAFNILRTSDDQVRFTLPVDVARRWQPLHGGLYLFEINGLSGEQASLNSAGRLTVDSYALYDARSRMHHDAVYFIVGSEVWSSFWQAPEAAEGPF